jgi:hypothetical protein
LHGLLGLRGLLGLLGLRGLRGFRPRRPSWHADGPSPAARRSEPEMRPTPLARRLPALLLAGLAGLGALAACAGTSSSADSTPRPERTRATARDLAFTETFEIRFGNDLVGYLVDVLEVPEGVVDARAYPPGTALIEDRNLVMLGFTSPRGTSYRFRQDGSAEAVGYGARNSSLAAYFRRNGDPTLTTLHPGTVPGR